MPSFFYKARDKKGSLVSGKAEAANANELSENLFSKGLIPLSVREIKKGGIDLQNIGDVFRRVKTEELMIFSRQFHTLFKAGVSMDTILGAISGQIGSRLLRSAIKKIRTDVAEGSSLSQAFGRHPHVFDEMYVSMLAAGEEGGILEQVLSQLVILLEKEDEIKRNVKSATLYPKIVIFVLVMAVIVLMTVVVPKFSAFYSHYGSDLPLPTLILIGTSNFIKSYWYIMLLAAAALYYSYRKYYGTHSGRLKIDALKFKLPVFGDLTIKIANARFGHILSSLYKSGLPMPRSLEVVANVIGNESFALEVKKLKDRIQKGATLSDSMSKSHVFPHVVIETTAVGEKTGALDDMLQAVADHFDLEVKHTIKNLTTLLEPLLLIGIFAMVTTLALSIFLPIWNMSRIVSGK
ncbi:MAG: type II secretion system F family protein [Deltaproteobacteria bacterium]|nr:type II secretion system F family protein [Deltaproteobacteria bacterium]MBI2975064.1 type II secretion system F family protein [Deltaproteobacteria bacterium]